MLPTAPVWMVEGTMKDRGILILNRLGGAPGVIRTPDPLLRGPSGSLPSRRGSFSRRTT